MSDNPTMRLVGHQLQCDAPACDHVEELAEITADLIGKPCPRCGANLLTEEDFIAGRAMLATLEAVAEVLPTSKSKNPEYVRMSINPHAGEVNVTFSPDNKDSG